MLFNILLYCHIKQCHTPEMPVIVVKTKIAEQFDKYKNQYVDNSDV